MLTQKEARYYNEQLHPIFAGYLHDGTITERDALATIFQLLTKGILDPIWQDHDMRKKLIGARRMQKPPQYPFEQIIIDRLFGDKKEITFEEMSDFIKSSSIQNIIRDNVKAITAFPVIREELKFTLGKHGKLKLSVNGNPVDTVEEATKFKKLLTHLLIPVFLGIGALLLLIYLLITRSGGSDNLAINNHGFSVQVNGNIQGSPESLVVTAGIMIGALLLIYLSFTFSKKTVDFSFENDVIPVAKKKYEELFEFLKKYPLNPHTFTNEFLSFAIAFGLDTSWHQDFGLEKEIKVDNTPITSH